VAVLGWLACRAPGWPDAASAALIAGWIGLSGLALVDLAGQQAGGAGVRLVPWALICLGCGSVLAVLRLSGRAVGPSKGLLGGA